MQGNYSDLIRLYRCIQDVLRQYHEERSIEFFIWFPQDLADFKVIY